MLLSEIDCIGILRSQFDMYCDSKSIEIPLINYYDFLFPLREKQNLYCTHLETVYHVSYF